MWIKLSAVTNVCYFSWSLPAVLLNFLKMPMSSPTFMWPHCLECASWDFAWLFPWLCSVCRKTTADHRETGVPPAAPPRTSSLLCFAFKHTQTIYIYLCFVFLHLEWKTPEDSSITFHVELLGSLNIYTILFSWRSKLVYHVTSLSMVRLLRLLNWFLQDRMRCKEQSSVDNRPWFGLEFWPQHLPGL